MSRSDSRQSPKDDFLATFPVLSQGAEAIHEYRWRHRSYEGLLFCIGVSKAIFAAFLLLPLVLSCREIPSPSDFKSLAPAIVVFLWILWLAATAWGLLNRQRWACWVTGMHTLIALGIVLLSLMIQGAWRWSYAHSCCVLFAALSYLTLRLSSSTGIFTVWHVGYQAVIAADPGPS